MGDIVRFQIGICNSRLRLGIKKGVVHLRFFIFPVFCLLLGGCAAVNWIPGLGPRKAAPGTAQTAAAKGLQWTARVEPEPIRLGEHRRAVVTLSLQNRSKRYVRLEFPTTQRFEVTVRDARGRALLQWSEDQPFEPESGAIGINPGELLEYRAVIATRDLVAGRRYTVAAWVTGHPELRVEVPIVPEP